MEVADDRDPVRGGHPALCYPRSKSGGGDNMSRLQIIKVLSALLLSLYLWVPSSSGPYAQENLQSLIEAAALQRWSFSQPSDFELPDSTGKPRSSREFRGQVVLLYMFGEW